MRNFKKFLALALAVMMVMSGVVTVSAAEEVTSAEETVVYDYTAAAEELAALGVVKGTSDDVIDFTLEDKVLRYQMTLLFARITTGECDDDYWKGVENTTPFNDIDNWFGAIDHCYEEGIIMGKEIDTFGPYDPITYEQALTMAVRALGYKQLDYYEGFVNFAKKLGLTNGLEELAIGTQLTRGQMFQITLNALFAVGTDGKTFAAKNFGVEEAAYVIVATQRQHLAGAGSKTGVEGLVRLAKLNADGTYDFENTILLNTETDLGIAVAQDVEAKLAYSYTIKSATNAGIYKITANDTVTYKNYGDDGKAIAAADTSIAAYKTGSVKINDVNYKVVDAYSANALANELIVHSLHKAATVTDDVFSFDYDIEGNILYPAGANAGKIALKYNATLGKYFYVVSYEADGTTPKILRPATEADLKNLTNASVSDGVKTYGLATAAEVLAYEFAQITMIDDNNDGTFDRAVYIPYSIGNFSTLTANYVMYFDTGVQVSTGNSAGTNYSVDGNVLISYYQAPNGKTYGVRTGKSQYIVRDAEGNKLDAVPTGKNIVYWYNPAAAYITVVETPVEITGAIDSFTFGTYNKTKAVFEDAKVTIAGVEYTQGYRNTAMFQMSLVDQGAKTTGYADAIVKTHTYKDLAKIDAELTNNGFDDLVLQHAPFGAVKPVKVVVLADRIISIAAAAGTAQYVAFDYGKFDTPKDDPHYFWNTKTYTGDIVGIDENGYIEVNAYVDATGVQQVAKIAKINGKDMAATLKQLSAFQDYAAGLGAYGYQYQTLVRQAIIDELAAFYKAGTQYVFIVTAKNEDGSIEIYTDLNLYGAGAAFRQPATKDSSVENKTLTFVNGVADVPYKGTKANENRLILGADAVITVAGKDGIKVYRGMPKNGDKLFIDTAACEFYAFDATKGQIFIASATKDCKDIFTGFATEDLTNAKYYLAYSAQSGFSTALKLTKAESKVTYAYDYAAAKWVATATYKLWDVVGNKSVDVQIAVDTKINADGILPGFTFETLTDLQKRQGVAATATAVEEGLLYVVVDGKLVAVEDEAAKYITEKVFPKVYASMSFVEAPAKVLNIFDFIVEEDLVDAKVLFNQIFNINFTYDANGDVTVGVAQKKSDDAAFAAALQGTSIFYNYTAGTSFKGAIVSIAAAGTAQYDAALAIINAAAGDMKDVPAVKALIDAAKDELAGARANDVIDPSLTIFMADTYADIAAEYKAKIEALVAELTDSNAAAALAQAKAEMKTGEKKSIEKACYMNHVYYRYEPAVFELAKKADAAIDAATSIAQLDAIYEEYVWGNGDHNAPTAGIVYEILQIVAAKEAADKEAAALLTYKAEKFAEVEATAGAIAKEADIVAVLAQAKADIDAEADTKGVDEAVVVAKQAVAAAVAKYNAELATAKDAANKYVDDKTAKDAAGKDVTLTAEKAAAKIEIAAADTKEKVETAKANFDKAVEAAVKAADDAADLLKAKNDAWSDLQNAMKGYTQYSAVQKGYSDAWEVIKAAKTVDAVNTAKDDGLKAIAEAKADIDAQRLEAATPVVTIKTTENITVIELFNLSPCSKIEFYADADANGATDGLYKTKYAQLAPAFKLANGTQIGTYKCETTAEHIDGVKNDDTFTVTAAVEYVDEYGNYLPVLATGETYGVTVYDLSNNVSFEGIVTVG